jgi:hypothetical protein
LLFMIGSGTESRQVTTSKDGLVNAYGLCLSSAIFFEALMIISESVPLEPALRSTNEIAVYKSRVSFR